MKFYSGNTTFLKKHHLNCFIVIVVGGGGGVAQAGLKFTILLPQHLEC